MFPSNVINTWIISPYCSDSESICSWWVSFTSVPTRKTTFTFLRVSVSFAHDSLMLYRASKLGTELHTMTRRKGWASLEVLEALHTSGLRMVVRLSGRISSRALRDWLTGQTKARGPEIQIHNHKSTKIKWYLFSKPFGFGFLRLKAPSVISTKIEIRIKTMKRFLCLFIIWRRERIIETGDINRCHKLCDLTSTIPFVKFSLNLSCQFYLSICSSPIF